MSTLATNGVDYSEKLIVKESVCHRFLFSDFSGQERLYPILKGYMKSLQAAILVVDVSDPSTMKYILKQSKQSIFNNSDCFVLLTFIVGLL